MEEWRNIKDFEGFYQVSNLGRVRSLGNGNSNNSKEKILKPGKDKKGYLFVILCKDGKPKIFKVHRLVTQTFLPNPDNLPEINHIDEDKTNNRVDNLEWKSHKDNINHGTRNERVSKTMTNGKLSKPVLQFSKSGEFIKEWPSTAECSRNGYDFRNVSACCRGEKKSAYGYIWKYK